MKNQMSCIPMMPGSRLLLLTLLTATSILGFTQTGAVSGIVLDHAEGSTLPGANIYLKGNESTGTVTDINGQFVLSGLDLGDHVVVASFIGFVVQEIPVQISAKLGLELKVLLDPDAVLGKEVLVLGQALGQAKAINQQLNAESIANIVSSDRIQELPDVNAAEAIARLPGVSINRDGGEGQKIVIRGLEPKFNAITVNGIRLPANDAGDRSVDLSLISPEMLEGIEVFKAPLPYMDAEAVGGTVNLKLRKAAPDLKVVGKLLGGYNDLNNDWSDYKGVLQGSKRIFADKLGIVLQGSLERFNRGGDFTAYDWRRGATDAATGTTAILGAVLRLENRAEVRSRLNASMNLDYDLGGNHSITLFGLHSKTERDRFDQRQIYIPPGILRYTGQEVENDVILSTLALGGEHPFGPLLLDWKIGHSRSEGSTPYDFYIGFDGRNPFDESVLPNAHPRTYLDHARPDFRESFIYGKDEHRSTITLEESTVAMVDLKIPVMSGDKIGGYFKFGVKYLTLDRSRQVTLLTGESEDSPGYERVAEAYGAEKLIYTRANLISMLSFTGNNFDFKDPDGNTITKAPSLDPNLLRDWYDAQVQAGLLQNDRKADDERYMVTETIAAGYAMLRLNIGKALTIIPGFRFEQSDNDYTASVSTVSGKRGANGFFRDTTTFQKYGEFLPHLHLKYQALDWFDIRASYTETLARPDYYYVTPRAEIDNTAAKISAGNPNLRHARATNYDLYFSAYKGGLGLLSFGAFYKEIDDIFYPRTIQLADAAIATANGWPKNEGYELSSFTNADQSTVKGFEIDLQTNLGFLPEPFNGIVINANYARLYSETQVFFLTSETVGIPIPPFRVTTYTSNARLVTMPSQAPHILHLSLGYDLGGFSARVSGVFQGTKATTYNLNKDFDEYTLEFWRWDASLKQDFGTNWSFFVNLNNFNNQQDISFTRNENYLNTIQTFGFTGTAGVQFRL